jgi:PKD repeat protein
VRSITSVLRQDFYLSIASNSPATVLLHHKPIALVPLSLALMTACGGGDLVLPENGSAVAIRVVDGDGQQGAVGAPLGAPVVVEVTSAGGDPVPGAMVEFALTSAGDGGEIAPATALTSADGRAQAHVLLGDKVGLQTGEARVPGGTRPSTTFSALAVAGDNQEPGVSFGWACEELACQFTDASTDRDGTVTGWAWDFGDGSGSADPEPSHTYSASGTYTVTLTVTDDGGSTGTSSKQVAVTASPASPGNNAPHADFEVACKDLRCTFTDRSRDDDGSIASRLWDFGDGSTATERHPSHTYASGGRYDVVLTVADDDGASATRTRQAEAAAPPPTPPPQGPPPPDTNDPPQAEFQVTCQELRCAFTDQSRDEDGSITGRRWDFGDGTTSEARNPSHSYTSAGQFTVVLAVTDDDGASDTQTHAAQPTEPAAPPPPEPNTPPRAEFAVTCQDLTCTFTDRSEDGDGSIASRRWDFGDGVSSTERNPSHTYAAAGRFDVVLTVTDDDGAMDSETHSANPAEPPPPPPANDPPNAEFQVTCQELRCTFLDRSTDGDGSIVRWQWDFGDGATSSERNPSHDYASGGRFDVLLVVTDDDGAADTQTHRAEPREPPPPPANEPPHADFDVRCSGLTCTFTDKSKDEDGTVVSWQWNFGDGVTSTEQNPVHTYPTSGRFDATLTVTDDDGATGTKARRAEPKG